MFSRTKRIFGIAALAFAAATAMAVPAHADDDRSLELRRLQELAWPFCLTGTELGIPIVDVVLPEFLPCADAKFLN
ncbi:hypothetical protein [Nonomuraea zeae]|uniref:Uncharacterized protein n=1 Tax=Nonomuraea zeae TaxID=1642303 RepID=A0A5S4FAH6_9ACTN|nr:hypothetical protein [Nonomuraea zeae]TMR14144.1 hypothetical protein ETD85_57025 [Nonomuraea zeae]